MSVRHISGRARPRPAGHLRTLRAAFVVLLLLGGASVCGSQERADAVQLPQREGWQLVWHDEFEAAALDPASWTFDLGAGGWGNRELELYTKSTDNVRVEGGMLVIEARAEEKQGMQYTSGRIKTQGRVSWTYGRIEARIKVPEGNGIWPAFWMLGENIPIAPWPNCGEIDIMEVLGRQPEILHGTVHGPGYSASSGPTKSFAFKTLASFASDFHLYAVEWDAERIQWSVDDVVYFAVTPADVGPHKKWVFDHPFFVLLNVAVGGTWPGSPDDTTVFPQRMLVDYVRVWQREK
jgi:beta-glucanase (GH16 family)